MNLAQQWHDDSTAMVSNVECNAVAPNYIRNNKTNCKLQNSLKYIEVIYVFINSEYSLYVTRVSGEFILFLYLWKGSIAFVLATVNLFCNPPPAN